MELVGRWDLEVSTPFGKHPATLVVEAGPGGGLSGRIDSRLGTAALDELSETAAGLEATVSLELKGNTYAARVTATVSDGRIEGQIKVNIPFAPPARFTGVKQ